MRYRKGFRRASMQPDLGPKPRDPNAIKWQQKQAQKRPLIGKSRVFNPSIKRSHRKPKQLARARKRLRADSSAPFREPATIPRLPPQHLVTVMCVLCVWDETASSPPGSQLGSLCYEPIPTYKSRSADFAFTFCCILKHSYCIYVPLHSKIPTFQVHFSHMLNFIAVKRIS